MDPQAASHPEPARAFGRVAEVYHRGRPGYPEDAVRWLVGDRPAQVLELGAGTGKLTARLVELGHEVHATDPDPAMLAVLETELPGVRTTVAAAERLPVADRSVDVVVCGQSFHWFDHPTALEEIARVLRPGGRLAVVWYERDERIPWVKRLGRLLGRVEQLRDPSAPLTANGRYGEVETSAHRFWQTIDRESVQDLVVSRSHVALADPDTRAALLAQVVAFYDDYGRGMYGMELPYIARCFRAEVVDQPAETLAVGDHAPDAGANPIVDTGSHPPIADELFKAPRALDDDTGMLLIDFR
ncbi:class I SAM-dependent methyltransferase [Nocardioides fonticola]|uniref:Class I SAM-dependent methyltransferase n=1 Tax=Nocardioides fonticola TaxID=450363 RepID=A0ABP7XNB6_9ACTN